jgi:hypothetical protein
MGKVWSMDAVAKKPIDRVLWQRVSTRGIAEERRFDLRRHGRWPDSDHRRRRPELAQGRKDWRRAGTRLRQRIVASVNDPNTVYVAFENHQNADFKPYLFKSTDAGRTWTSIKANLPANQPVWGIAEDHVNPNLLFAGTEYGLFFTIDGGQKWIQMRGGLPTIQVRDIAIPTARKRSRAGNFRARLLHSRQLHAAARSHAGNGETGSRALSDQRRAHVHPGAAHRRSRQIFPGSNRSSRLTIRRSARPSLTT